jgi:2-C-methyl-D-erythritol 4-phosphate cytidylyltransferase
MEGNGRRGKHPEEQVTGVIVAGGSSTRMGFDKLWVDLAGKPLVAWSMLAFSECDAIDRLIVVASADCLLKAEDLLRDLAVEATVVQGGAARRDSVLAGLESTEGKWVVIHDAARPLVEPDLIVRGLEAARETGAAIAGVPETSTIKRVRGGEVLETLDRDALWAAQTPQVFRRELLLEAHRRAGGPATDDAVLVEALGVRVRVYEGGYANIKVTTPVDLQLAALLLSARRGFRPAAGAN